LPSGWTWGLENFLVDPQVALLGLLAVPLLHLGSVEQARASLQRAYVRARDREWPMARLAALWYSALFEVRLGKPERVAALADEMHALVDEFALAAWSNCVPVVSRLGGLPGRANRATAIAAFERRTKTIPARDAGGRK
jgi:hypothetical protein